MDAEKPTDQSTPTPHDALFRHVFSQPEHAAAELRHVLPEKLGRAIDWPSLRVRQGTWIDHDLRASHADLLCHVRLAGRPAFVYLLLEHKANADLYTVFQLLIYCVRIWQDYRRENPTARRLPPIVPVVLHHSEHGWSAPRRMRDLIELEPELRSDLTPFIPDFEFALDDLSTEREEDLHARAMSAQARLALLCLKQVRHSANLAGELRRWKGAMRAVLEAEDGLQALAAVLSYIMAVGAMPPEKLEHLLVAEVGRETKDKVMNTLDQAREQARREGRAELLTRQLTLKFGALSPVVAQRLQEAQAEQLDLWAERILSANTLDDVFGEAS